jgi:hypothetical protein
MRRLALPAILLIFGGVGVHAQTPTPDPPARRGLWEAKMPAGSYLVRLDAITSISRHSYLVDGVGRVSEVVISAHGPALTRFYYVAPNIPQAPGGVGQSTLNFAEEKMREISDRTGAGEVWTKVVKSYPMATHAHTVEYRLETEEGLRKLFEDLERAFTSGRGSTFTP